MLIFLTLTQECNLHCTYCGGGDQYIDIEEAFLHALHPKNVIYDFGILLQKLVKLAHELAERSEDLIICFYGGEPLMEPELIDRCVETLVEFPHVKFVLQTNGLLLSRKFFKWHKLMDTVLLSVDGDSEVTDLCRGEGTYDQAIRGALSLRSKGFEGDLIARMTIHQQSDVFEDVRYLLNYRNDITGKYLFDHVHWQLDVLWDSPGLSRWEGGFPEWRDESYNPGITRLGEYFLSELQGRNSRGTKRVLGIAPLLGVLYSHLTGEREVPLRCGSGLSAFNVSTGGVVTSCPVAAEYDKVCMIDDDGLSVSMMEERGQRIGGYCEGCEVLDECGGRCLHVNKKTFAEDDRENFDQVCETVKHLLRLVREEILPVVQGLITSGEYSIEDFHYPKYNNTVEVIP